MPRSLSTPRADPVNHSVFGVPRTRRAAPHDRREARSCDVARPHRRGMCVGWRRDRERARREGGARVHSRPHGTGTRTHERSLERLHRHDGRAPLHSPRGVEEYRPGLAFVSSFANVVAARTGEGIVLVDTGSFFSGEMIRGQLREWSTDAIHTAVYTHGHVDHATGIGAFRSRGQARGRRPVARRGAPRGQRPLRAVQAHGGVQRRDQRATVPRGDAVAHGVSRPRRGLRRKPRPRRGRRALRAPPRARRDRRPHVALDPGASRGVHGRPLHLGLAQLRKSPEGAALRGRSGRGARPHGRARWRAALSRSRPRDRGRGSARARRSRRRRRSCDTSTTRPWRA